MVGIFGKSPQIGENQNGWWWTQSSNLSLPCILEMQGDFAKCRASCPFRKSYPDVLMMQSCQDGNSDNGTRPLDCSTQGRIFL